MFYGRSYGLLKDTSSILLDRNIDPEETNVIKETIEADADNRISDLSDGNFSATYFSSVVPRNLRNGLLLLLQM